MDPKTDFPTAPSPSADYVLLPSPAYDARKAEGRSPKLNTPLHRLLVLHAMQNAEQRRKTREEIASELRIEVCKGTLV
jgi:hypothetical protein